MTVTCFCLERSRSMQKFN